MVAKVRFWFLESSRLIAKASFSVMILKSLYLYSLFITRPCFGFNHSNYVVKTDLFFKKKEQSYVNISYLLQQHKKLF